MNKTQQIILDQIEKTGCAKKTLREYNCSGDPVTEKRWHKAMVELRKNNRVNMAFRILKQDASTLFSPSTLVVSYILTKR